MLSELSLRAGAADQWEASILITWPEIDQSESSMRRAGGREEAGCHATVKILEKPWSLSDRGILLLLVILERNVTNHSLSLLDPQLNSFWLKTFEILLYWIRPELQLSLQLRNCKVTQPQLGEVNCIIYQPERSSCTQHKINFPSYFKLLPFSFYQQVAFLQVD